MLPQPSANWLLVTHLGAAGIVLPLLATIAVALRLAGQRPALRAWVLAMAAGVTVVLATKVAFIGWGWGSAALDFTGISGHTMLAASVFPLWLGWLLAGPGRRASPWGTVLGLAIAGAVGWSRLALGAHSPSEVVIGWLVGAAVSLVACASLAAQERPRGWAGLVAGAVLLSALSPSVAGYLPTHKWEVRVALALSGHARPYVRQDLHRQPKPDLAQAAGPG
ncbi:phosphatase PAP2 family protein [Thiobacillus sedimenti]|uniref:Phosphatase PAP2 family protein n=1 Tax=Thiobacillus sedimenti TaxID=3110231 RepID=A0ABZ1CMK6_9PROT|nr:phosphatase PAP2 family protein [Thiobacillus sp. SCUT-2]WRS40091.1 phosphatase PAP2 family protein [Thiobacillus sp. SCUT-2]